MTTASLDHIPEPYRSAHKESSQHRQRILAADRVGCFFCLATDISPMAEIRDWIDKDQTALCPRCGIDSVLARTEPEFLSIMRMYWFSIPGQVWLDQ